MNERPAIAPRLRELDRELAARRMPPGARERVAKAIAARGEQRRSWLGQGRRGFAWLPAATFVAGALLVLAVIAGGGRDDRGPRTAAVAHAPSMPVLEGFAVDGATCNPRRLPVATQLTGDCRLVSKAMVIRTFARVQLRRDGDLLRVQTGTALFEVEHVPDDAAPVRIGVSHGVIEVIGTRFVVEQRPTGGHVDLLQGRIAFHEDEGDVVDILPGQRHAWGAAQPASEARKSVPASNDGDASTDTVDILDPAPPVPRRSRRSPGHDATTVIERVEQLRSTGRASQAARLLRRALRRDWDSRTAQVLSFELGEVLHDDLGDREAARAHLRAHQRRYPNGRYFAAIERILAREHTRAR